LLVLAQRLVGQLASRRRQVLTRIGRGRFRKLYVGIYGDESSLDNQRIMQRANALAKLRTAAYPLEVAFYDAASANVWGGS